MDWLNLHTSVLDSPAVVGAEPVDRGTWLMLQRYCIGQENGGRIAGCRGWKDRKWQQLAKVTLAEINRETELWAWNGEDLDLAFYPLEKEAEVQHLRAIGKLSTPAKRAAAKANGQLGGRPAKTQQETQQETEQEPNKKPIQGKGREVEGEWKGKEAAAAAMATRLCLAHPKRAETGPALSAALAALRKHPFEKILEGTLAYAGAVAAWTDAEKLQFVKNPEEFFRDDIWNQPAENWRSRKGLRTVTNGHHKTPDTGGRRPSLALMNEIFPTTTKP
jgi:hypothetical protein